MKIEHTASPESKDIDFLTRKIHEETPEYGSASSFGFFIRDDHDNIIAGCNGFVFYGNVYTDQLWVHPDYRGKGYGQKLMESVHDYGRENECTMATLVTMSFQNATKFYENLGYERYYERVGHTKGSSCLFLKKML